MTATRVPRPALERLRALTAAPPEPKGPARPIALLALACVALAALSLLGPSTPTYDPWAWIIWGREVVHLDLVTTDGPSWKPLPILFTAPFSLVGDGPAPELWLLVARTGAGPSPTSENGAVNRIGSGFHDGPSVVTRSRCMTSRPQMIQAHGS